MSTRIENGSAVSFPRPAPAAVQSQPVAAPPVAPQARRQEFRDGFESQGPRRDLFQPASGTARADLPKRTVAELMRTGSASVPSTAQAEALVKEAYAQVLMREPDAGGAQLYKDKALELARNGASADEIRDSLRQELSSSPEGQAISAVNAEFQSELGRTPETKGYWHEQALQWQAQGASVEDIHQRLQSSLHASPERALSHPEEFLNAQYQRLLGRDADGEGLATYSAKMREMNAAGASFEDIQQAIAQDIQSSPEYQTRQAQQASSTSQVPAGGSAPASSSGATPSTPSSTPASLQGITPSQINDAAGFSDQWSLCGPIAAVAATRAAGKPVSLEEARQVAINGGNYTPGDGMHGAASEVRLLKDLGVPAHTESPVDWDTVKAQVQSGKPVIISTPNHYFVIEGYDASTGKFDCGNSALAMKASGGTQTWLTPSDLANWGGGAPTAIVLD